MGMGSDLDISLIHFLKQILLQGYYIPKIVKQFWALQARMGKINKINKTSCLESSQTLKRYWIYDLNPGFKIVKPV